MNPLAFEPTDMDIVALCDNVSCDVEPLVRLLIDMKSKHAGLFGELMPALETALSRNSTKLVDVITRIFGGAKDIDKLFDENMFKAPMSNEMNQYMIGQVMRTVDMHYEIHITMAMNDREEVPPQEQKIQSLIIQKMAPRDPVYVQFDNHLAETDWYMPAADFVRVWNAMMAQKKEREAMSNIIKGQINRHLDCGAENKSKVLVDQKLKRAKATRAMKAAWHKANVKDHEQQLIADVAATDAGQLARVALQQEEEDEFRAALGLLQPPIAVDVAAEDSHGWWGTVYEHVEPAIKTEAGAVTTSMHFDQILDALI